MSAFVEHSVVINGERLPLHECNWTMFAPCGCVSGVMVADLSDRRYQRDAITTVEQAWEHMYDSRIERERDQKRGFRFELMPRCESIDLMKGDCQHEPKWGYEHAPTLDGYAWAAISQYGSRSSLMHLVSSEAVEAYRNHQYGYPRTSPLCEGKPQWAWSEEWHATDGKVECKRCWAAAKKMNAEAAS
jgi:hypothetical protein